MADQRAVKQNLRRLERVKTWQLVVVFILLLLISATFLRLNNIGMIERREAVEAADRLGDDFAVQNRLYDLQTYSSKRMNASTEVHLVKKYERDVERLANQAREANQSGDNIFVASDNICRQRHSGYSQAYVFCMDAELAKYPPGEDPVSEVNLPSAALYRHSFSSPAWSADFAGWSLLLTAVVGLAIMIRIIVKAVLHALLRQRYQPM